MKKHLLFILIIISALFLVSCAGNENFKDVSSKADISNESVSETSETSNENTPSEEQISEEVFISAPESDDENGEVSLPFIPFD